MIVSKIYELWENEIKKLTKIEKKEKQQEVIQDIKKVKNGIETKSIDDKIKKPPTPIDKIKGIAEKPIIKPDIPKKPEKAAVTQESFKVDETLDENEKPQISDLKIRDNEIQTGEIKESPVEKEIEELLINLNSFVKPHGLILNYIRQIKPLSEEDYDVDKRRDIIDNLHNKGKIFTYDGTSYIGKGQISNLVKSNSIISTEDSYLLQGWMNS